jgi:threonylcarbamoyladenosine tRNA methylthiotransferase MtaB
LASYLSNHQSCFDLDYVIMLPCSRNMFTVAYHTLGCKVNQYETEKIRESLETIGFVTVPFGSQADVYVINTCSVTHTADSKSRAAIRQALKRNAGAYVVVTGCYSERDPALVRGIEGVDLVVGNEEKDQIPERIAARFGVSGGSDRLSVTVRPRLRTRAIVKVQDGCDHFCAYCIVPYVRRRKSSRPMEKALEEIRLLAEFGYKEVVLTGIRLGSYQDGSKRLPDLIKAAVQLDGIKRIRLSSIEPWEVDDALLEAMSHTKVCRHLHIPLQSGDSNVLERMGRPYTGDQYLSIVSRVRERLPGIGITTDVIVGFPGETEKEFENTLRMIDDVGFSRLHVFRYSPRKGTKAAAMPDQVDPAVKKERAERLSEKGMLAMRKFAESLIGQVTEVLVERKIDGKQLAGFADNYVEVRFPGEAALIGRVVRVRILGTDRNGKAAVGMNEGR